MSLSVATATIPLPAIAAPAGDETGEAKRLYEEGKTAYRLGRFDEAVQKFEAAYAASALPTILYNIGLSYERLYTTSSDVAHLRKAKVLLQNFLLETHKDPSLGDPAEVENQIAGVDKAIADHETAIAEREAGVAAEREKAQRAQQEAEDAKNRLEGAEKSAGPVGPDPGKKDRRMGGMMIGVGAAVGIGGALGGVVFGLQGQGFEDDLIKSQGESDDLGCTDPSDSDECAALDNQQAGLTRNGEKANTAALAVGLTGAVVGLAVIGTGVGMMIRGNKRTKRWKGGSDLSISPTRRGFVISGRF